MNNNEFFKNISYTNDIQYVQNNINANLTIKEITNKDILDFGCGIGQATYIFHQYAPSKVTGIDIGENNIKICNSKKESNEKIEFIMADLNSYDLGSNKYDLIWTDTTIEFLQKELDKISADFKKCLKPNGILYMSFTKKTLGNILLYFILSILKYILPIKFRKILYYIILIRYYFYSMFSKKKINKENIRNKVEYLFVPYIKLISEKEIIESLENNNFKILYLRDRIKSDINSPAHLEVKAVLLR